MEILDLREEQLSTAIRAFSRRQILRFLAKQELTVNEIALKTKQSKSLASKHLALLYNSGFLQAKLKSPYKYYSLKNKQIEQFLIKYDQTVSSLSSSSTNSLQELEIKLSQAISALSRRQILRFLAEKELTVNEVASLTGITKSLASRHLKLLFEFGFLEAKVQSPFKYYSLRIKKMKILLEEYDQIIEKL